MEGKSMMMDVKGIRQGYGERDVISDVSFQAHTGEVVTVLGPNGSGKSTLIKTMCRIMEPRDGAISIDGQIIEDIPRDEFAKIVGYVPQDPEFIGYSSVYDSVLVGRRPYVQWNYSREDIAKAAEAMKFMKVDGLYDRQVSELSGGQRQRVTLARALAQDPMFYIFDEPTSALDLRNQLDTLKIMRRIIKERNTCMVVALHDLNLALRYSDKVLVIHDGTSYAFGAPEEVITEKMISDVYGVESEIVDGQNGRYVHAYDSEMDEAMAESIRMSGPKMPPAPRSDRSEGQDGREGDSISI